MPSLPALRRGTHHPLPDPAPRIAPVIDGRTLARSIRFQRHPELTACWVWTGSTDRNGIAIVFVDGTVETARRAVYRRYRGGPPGRLDTRCHTKLCVNPNHVRPKQGTTTRTTSGHTTRGDQ
ncbi:hypothetical protein MTY414_73950 [Mycolicibacterium mageritense]|nr:hypothetical protein MTY414_73950 [Mycolicibacterium mageritense]